MWKHLYDWIIELLTGLRWSGFLAAAQLEDDQSASFRELFREDLYPAAGYLWIAGTLAGLLIYYFVLNRKGGSGYYFKRKYWFRSLLATGLAVGLVTFVFAQVKVHAYAAVRPFRFEAALGTANLLYTVILFALLSLLFKKFSVANTTPF